MKTTFYTLLLISAALLSNCKKQSTKTTGKESRPASFTENKTIPVNSCSPFTQNAINYAVCLDSVINESRCPQGAQCIWAGYAQAKFTFSTGPLTHHFYLYTLIQSGAGSFPNDTTINGIKIQMVNLSPYPGIFTVINYNDYKADVLIT